MFKCLRSILLLSGGLLAGCNNPENPASAPADPGSRSFRIGVVLPTFAHPFFIAQKAGLEAAAREQPRISLEVRDGKDDDRTQIEQVESLLTLGVDLIILVPRDQEAVRRAVDSAENAGVPVIALNRRVAHGTVVCYVGADDIQAGRMQAQALMDAVEDRPCKVLYLQGTQGSSPQIQRSEGFKQAIANQPNIQIVEERYCDFQADKTKSDLALLAQRIKPGDIQAIVAQNDEMAIPAAEVARSEGWNDVVVIGCDGTKQAFDAIRAGTMNATVLQDAAEQGRIAFQAADSFLREQPIEKEIITPLPIITRQSIDAHAPSY